jgi:hypothetical protein
VFFNLITVLQTKLWKRQKIKNKGKIFGLGETGHIAIYNHFSCFYFMNKTVDKKDSLRCIKNLEEGFSRAVLRRKAKKVRKILVSTDL